MLLANLTDFERRSRGYGGGKWESRDVGKWGSGEVGKWGSWEVWKWGICFVLLCFALLWIFTRTRNEIREIRPAKDRKEINPTRHESRDEKE